ncbi:MAG: CHAT domain-containing protein [Acetobacteraceae bacterium]|nr:CHAT domain-containing protein [Acetobacteraceae bacterium]
MTPARSVVALAAAALLAACDVPPPEAYVSGGRGPVAAAQPAGQNAQGEPCVIQPSRQREGDPEGARPYDLFCGTWQQPSARLLLAATGDLDALVAGGAWRRGLDQRAACGAARTTTILAGSEARLLDCTRRSGGWPHVALLARTQAGVVMADGVLPSLPAIEGAAAVLGGAAPPATGASRSAALTLASARLAQESFSSNDISQYEDLMRLGNELNQAENFAAAENAYRAALALHERVLGADNPGGTGAAMALALQLSNQGRILEADALLARAEARVTRSADPLMPGRLLHYRAMHAGNQGNYPEAERLVTRAEAALRAQLPPQVVRTAGGGAALADAALADRGLLADATALQGLAAYAEARRYHAVVLRRLGRTAEADVASREARSLVLGFAADSPVLAARAARTEGDAARLAGDPARAADLFSESARLFSRAVPEERPVALARFRAGAALVEAGQRDAALAAFRDGARILRERRLGLSADAVMPYLDALAEAAAEAASPAPLIEEMFEAAQAIRGGITARLIAQAAARLGAADSAGGAGAAIRRLQDEEERLAALFARRDATADLPAETRDARAIAELDREIAAAQAARAAAEEEVQAAAPGYRQLVLGTTTAAEARARLGEGEVLALIVQGATGGHTLLLDRGGIATRRITLGEAEITRLVTRVRGSIELRFDGPRGAPRLPEFDADAAHALWQGLFGPLGARLGEGGRLVVVPSGALLSLPFALLPTAAPGPGSAPAFLVARMAVTHMPSVQSFVSLRGAASASRARNPYLGFGDFVPPSPVQVAASFPQDRCATDAAAVRALSPLPGTRAEVEAARRLLGAPASDTVMGSAFTPAAVRGRALADYRIVHFAAHAVLPAEIRCLAEPAILASVPAGGAAAAAFLPASEILGLSMDADLAILSACNSGGEGSGAGESLSGLARAFFYAGARGLMVTHWSVDDTASALLVAETLRRLAGGGRRATDALREAQLAMIADAGAGRLPPVFAHPFFWAGFALVGDGGAPSRPAG